VATKRTSDLVLQNAGHSTTLTLLTEMPPESLEPPLEINPTVAAALKPLDYDGVTKIEYNAEYADALLLL
jgi:hypothetical protein